MRPGTLTMLNHTLGINNSKVIHHCRTSRLLSAFHWCVSSDLQIDVRGESSLQMTFLGRSVVELLIQSRKRQLLSATDYRTDKVEQIQSVDLTCGWVLLLTRLYNPTRKVSIVVQTSYKSEWKTSNDRMQKNDATHRSLSSSLAVVCSLFSSSSSLSFNQDNLVVREEKTEKGEKKTRKSEWAPHLQDKTVCVYLLESSVKEERKEWRLMIMFA